MIFQLFHIICGAIGTMRILEILSKTKLFHQKILHLYQIFFFKLKTHFEKGKRKKEKKKGSNTKLDLILPTNTICLLSSNVHTHTHIHTHTHTHTNTHTQRQIAKSSFKGSNNDITKGIIKKVEHRQL